MIESHLMGGRQDLVPGEPLAYGQSITDACLSWKDTVPALETLALAAKARRTHAAKSGRSRSRGGSPAASAQLTWATTAAWSDTRSGSVSCRAIRSSGEVRIESKRTSGRDIAYVGVRSSGRQAWSPASEASRPTPRFASP